jgi:uncharacterized LabA/DUF88 family protein
VITGIFADLSSIYMGVKHKYHKKVDYGKVLDLFDTDEIVRAYAYSQQSEEEAPAFILALKHLGYTTKFVKDWDWHVELTLDVVRIADKLQKAVFMTNDIYFEHLFQWCRHRGIFVHLINCLEEETTAADHYCDRMTYIDPKLLEYNEAIETAK